MSDSSLVIDKLNLKFGIKRIISDLSLCLRESEIHTVIGLSGSGKTQFLRSIVGLNDAEPSLFKNKTKRIVFQENNLIPWLTLEQNVKVTTNCSDVQIDEMFKTVELQHYKQYKPSQVSGGMQQRVSLIRALIDKCDILLLDEAFSKLDPVNKQINYDMLLKLWKVNRPTILMVTHDLDEAIYFSQNISFFSKTEKKITYTQNIDFPYPRETVEIRKTNQYFEIFNKFNQLLNEDFKNANME